MLLIELGVHILDFDHRLLQVSYNDKQWPQFEYDGDVSHYADEDSDGAAGYEEPRPSSEGPVQTEPIIPGCHDGHYAQD